MKIYKVTLEKDCKVWEYEVIRNFTLQEEINFFNTVGLNAVSKKKDVDNGGMGCFYRTYIDGIEVIFNGTEFKAK